MDIGIGLSIKDIPSEDVSELCPMTFKSSLKIQCNSVYLKVSMKNSLKSDSSEGIVFLKNIISKDLVEFFGELCRLLPVDILLCNHDTKEVLIRCNAKLSRWLLCSLQFHEKTIDTNKVSYNNPICLIFDSRNYNHCLKRKRKKREDK